MKNRQKSYSHRNHTTAEKAADKWYKAQGQKASIHHNYNKDGGYYEIFSATDPANINTYRYTIIGE